MKVNYVKLTAGVLTGFMALSSVPYAVYAAGPTAGVASYTSDIVGSSNTLTAGVTSMLTDIMLKGDQTSETATDVAATEAEPVKSAYADTAVAQVNDSVNIRANADENSDVLGKLYNNGVGTVLETTDNGWYKIQSGSVTGYVKSEYVVVGDDALVQSVGRRVAKVNTETLKVRTSTSTDSAVLGLVSGEDDLTVVDEATEGWVGVSTADGTGYVSSDYVTLNTEFTYAESKEEEAARLAKEEAERKNQRDAVFQKWDREAEELKRFYPQFDLQTEIQDQRFLDLMGAGINMRTIYETLHHDEIIPALMQQTAKATAKQQAAAVQSGQMRPAENGMSSHPAAQIVKDPAKMTKEERQEYARRAARGEIITFRE